MARHGRRGEGAGTQAAEVKGGQAGLSACMVQRSLLRPKETIVKKGLLFLGTILLSLAVSPASGKAVNAISSDKPICPADFCQRCVRQGGTCSQGADTCFCTFG